MIEPTGEQLWQEIAPKPKTDIVTLTRKLFYLATPYSDKDPSVQESRFLMACDITGFLMSRGLYVYSPIAHTHPIACRCALPKGFDFWEGYGRCFLKRCDGVLLVMADGWQESKGVQTERMIALEVGIPVHFVWYPDFKDWFDLAESTL